MKTQRWQFTWLLLLKWWKTPQGEILVLFTLTSLLSIFKIFPRSLTENAHHGWQLRCTKASFLCADICDGNPLGPSHRHAAQDVFMLRWTTPQRKRPTGNVLQWKTGRLLPTHFSVLFRRCMTGVSPWRHKRDVKRHLQNVRACRSLSWAQANSTMENRRTRQREFISGFCSIIHSMIYKFIPELNLLIRHYFYPSCSREWHQTWRCGEVSHFGFLGQLQVQIEHDHHHFQLFFIFVGDDIFPFKQAETHFPTCRMWNTKQTGIFHNLLCYLLPISLFLYFFFLLKNFLFKFSYPAIIHWCTKREYFPVMEVLFILFCVTLCLPTMRKAWYVVCLVPQIVLWSQVHSPHKRAQPLTLACLVRKSFSAVCFVLGTREGHSNALQLFLSRWSHMK